MEVGGTLFFAAEDGFHPRELWNSDGTEAGTVPVMGSDPSDGASFPAELVDVGGTLFFTAIDGTHGRELWTSDGTEPGTVMVKDIHPGDRYSSPNYLTDVGGTLFFTANDGTHGGELWTSDGTEAGTVLVEDINVGGWFRVASEGRADTSRGTMRVKVRVAGDGRLVARPVAGSLLRTSVVDVASAGMTTIVLRPTRAGMRILRHNGRLRVRARFTFTPCGGTGSSVVHGYTLRLK